MNVGTLLRALALACAVASLASCGGAPPSDSGPGTDTGPITINSDAGSDSSTGGCVPACNAGEICLHPCGGAPMCIVPPAGCSGCSFSCNPCAGGSCGTVTPTDVFCTC